MKWNTAWRTGCGKNKGPLKVPIPDANVIGACTCVLSPVPLFAGLFMDDGFFTAAMLAATLLLAGTGAVFFIVAGVRWASMQKLLQEGEFTPRKSAGAGSRKPSPPPIGSAPPPYTCCGASGPRGGIEPGSCGRWPECCSRWSCACAICWSGGRTSSGASLRAKKGLGWGPAGGLISRPVGSFL